MALDPIRCAAKDLTDPCLRGLPMRLRLDGDPDDPSTWHPVREINTQAFREDLSLPFVQGITVAFHDQTTDVMFNENDDVEYAVPQPLQRS